MLGFEKKKSFVPTQNQRKELQLPQKKKSLFLGILDLDFSVCMKADDLKLVYVSVDRIPTFVIN